MLGSTYRLQLHGLGLVGATKIVPYLNELGIETLYLSPFLAATPGSSHGYDVIDPGRIDPAVGTDRDFQGLLDELADRGMHALLDVVPNHMAADPTNAWWWDVLARGVASPHAVVFDIDWSRHGGRVLVPTLSRPLAEVLAEGGGALADGVLDARRPAVSRGRRYARRGRSHVGPGGTSTSGPRTGGPPTRRAITGGSSTSDRWSACVSRTPTCSHARTRYILELCRHPAVAGLRVDHVDGLADPRAYLERLRRHLEQAGSGKIVLVEKILAPDEALDPRWPVEGTTGYEFADRAMGLFLEPAGCARLLELGSELTHTTDPTFTTLADQGKREVLAQSFSGDLDRLTRLTLGALDDEMPGHDLAQRDLRRAWNELTVHLSVYRTYLDGGRPSACDRERVGAAAAAATAHGGPELRRAVATITRALLERAVDEGPWLQVARRWQQLSGAVMAKGVEDTATYRYAGLPVRADVGGDPDEGGDPVAALHRLVAARAGGLNATSTHDSKRNEDARCRLAVLSEADGEWASLVRNWHRLFTAPGEGAGPTEELTVYQSLLALWPTTGDAGPGHGRTRQGLRVKAAREAKLRTSWSEPDERYEHEWPRSSTPWWRGATSGRR